MDSLLSWAENAGIENLKQQKAASDLLRKEGTTTLTVLLAGATGVLAYAVKGIESQIGWLMLGALVMSLFLYILSAYLVQYVLRFQGFPAIYNEPEHLYQKEFPLELMREVELKNIQQRIKQGSARNKIIFRRLNIVRTCATCSPLIFLLVGGGAYLFGGGGDFWSLFGIGSGCGI